MRALVLAAGEGTRLRPLTADRPKPMLPVGGRPLLEHIVRLLERHGIREIAINLHYRPQTIINYFESGSEFGVHIHYSFEQSLLGSAGAARRLGSYLGNSAFLVFYGDLYTDLHIGDLVHAHRQANASVTMALYRVENPSACGIVELNECSHVTRFVEKPSPDRVFSNMANAGVLVVEPSVLDLIPDGKAWDFGHDVFPHMLDEGLVIQGYEIQGQLIDIGTLENYCRAQRIAFAGAISDSEADVEVDCG